MHNPISRGTVPVFLILPVVVVPTLAGESLYNGIELPDAWPPQCNVNDEPMPVPYLEHPPSVIPIDVGRQLFVDDFLIESTTLKRVFHRPNYHSASPVLIPDKPWESGRWAMAFSDGVWVDPADSRFKISPEVFVGFSRDGFHWDRPDRRPFLAANEEDGAWNWGNVQSVGGCCLTVGDELYFYASGRAPEAQGGRKTTGLATMRRDGFASMDADTQPGTLTTRLVRFSGKHPLVNADVSGGALRVAILDSDGQVIEPFTAENCIPVREDSTRAGVKWKTAADLSKLAGQPVRFRFELSKGELYSFWVTP